MFATVTSIPSFNSLVTVESNMEWMKKRKLQKVDFMKKEIGIIPILTMGDVLHWLLKTNDRSKNLF